MSILRVYDPPDCDEKGIPLDLECCRNCEGVGWTIGSAGICEEGAPPSCGVCAGYGSLGAAALAQLSTPGDAADPWSSRTVIRCEDCNHPMSEGTWTEEDHSRSVMTEMHAIALEALTDGCEPTYQPVHYSPCDTGCRHGGRLRHRGAGDWWVYCDSAPRKPQPNLEASWRQIDIRTLGWPHDLRPEKLAVLCLRCWAERSAG